MAQDEDPKLKLLRPEAGDTEGNVPEVYRSLNFRSLQDPYSHSRDTMTSRYSTLRADNLETMLNGGLERFYKKYDHLSRKVNIQLPTPEVRFENLSFTVQVPASAEDHGTVGSHLRGIFTPWKKPAMVTKHALHPMSGIIKPGTLTLVLANPGAGKSTFLKALAGKLQSSSKTKLGGEILYSGLRGDEIDLIKLAGLVDQTDNHIPTLTVRETFKFADMCVNGLPEDQPEEMRDIAALRTELFIQILGLEECADTVVGDALLRGVSGGERKRVTIGEVLVGGQSHMMYHGPRTEILDYFEGHGFTCPPPLAAISVSFFLLFSGNIILADLIPDYWIWMYWFSPISWALRSNMLSEFSSDRYTDAQSKAQLESFSIDQGTGYIWFGVAVLIVYYFAFTSFNALALHYIRYEKFKGVSAKAMKQEEESHNVYRRKRQLLRKITAHFEPGRMVALMGATGAGKTTLMDWMSALMPNEKVANVAVGAISCLLNLFSGYLLPRTAMKAGYKWFTYLIPSSYSLSALVGVQFGEVQDIITVTSGNTSTDMTVAKYIEDIYDFRPERKYNFMIGLIVIWLVVQLAIYLTFKYVSHLKR
eukprot:jgi/Phyca11/20570/fgenesh1_pg.PHYCAscaffold_66_\